MARLIFGVDVIALCTGVGLAVLIAADDRLGPGVGAAAGRLTAAEAVETGVRVLLDGVFVLDVPRGAIEGLCLMTGRKPARAVAVSGALAPWTACRAMFRAAKVIGGDRTPGVLTSREEGEVVEGLPRVDGGREKFGSAPVAVPVRDIGTLVLPLAGVFVGDRSAVALDAGLDGELIRVLEDVGGGITPDMLGRWRTLLGLTVAREGAREDVALVLGADITGESSST